MLATRSAEETAILAAFVDATDGPDAGALVGTLRQTVGACPPDLFRVEH